MWNMKCTSLQLILWKEELCLSNFLEVRSLVQTHIPGSVTQAYMPVFFPHSGWSAPQDNLKQMNSHRSYDCCDCIRKWRTQILNGLKSKGSKHLTCQWCHASNVRTVRLPAPAEVDPREFWMREFMSDLLHIKSFRHRLTQILFLQVPSYFLINAAETLKVAINVDIVDRNVDVYGRAVICGYFVK